MIPLLEGEREVHALDMPGFGATPPLPPRASATAANLARAVHEECARNGVERPHVAGNSLGGWVALEMGRFGWAASVTTLSPAGLWSRPLGEPKGGGARMLLRGSPWLKAARPFLSVALQFPQTRARRLPVDRRPPRADPARRRPRARPRLARRRGLRRRQPGDAQPTSSTPPATPRTCR